MNAVGTAVFDLDGVVYRGELGIPGAGDALTRLQDAGWKLLYATNNASKTPQAVADKIASTTGFVADPAAVVTSAMAAAHFMDGRYRSAYVLGLEGLRGAVHSVGISVGDSTDVEAVVVGIDFDVTYDAIATAAAAIRTGAAFVATNTDATYPTDGGRLAPGAGAIVAAVATASGVEPIVCGKPHAAMGAMITELAEGPTIWMTGDRIETDIELAKNHGWRSILPLTGVTDSLDGIPADRLPDHVVASIADVPAIILDGAPVTVVSL